MLNKLYMCQRPETHTFSKIQGKALTNTGSRTPSLLDSSSSGVDLYISNLKSQRLVRMVQRAHKRAHKEDLKTCSRDTGWRGVARQVGKQGEVYVPDSRSMQQGEIMKIVPAISGRSNCAVTVPAPAGSAGL
jgi:hypothetical protein